MLYTLEDQSPQLVGDNYVAPNATLIGRITLEKFASVWFGCVLRGDTDDITVGEGSNIQDGSVLHTDHGLKLRVGANCTVGHMVMLHGCDIGESCLIGIRSVILNGAKIGRNSLVGAGTLIPERKVFPEGVLIMGTPGKVVRELTDQDLAMIKGSAQIYRHNALRYRGLILQPSPSFG